MDRVEEIGIVIVIIACLVTLCNTTIIPIMFPIIILALFIGISNNFTHSRFVSAKTAQSASLPQTPNMRNPEVASELSEKKEISSTPDNKIESKEDKPKSTMNNFNYTIQGMQARLDERIFQKETLYQNRESRVRMLNSMYKELVDHSVKSDPFLRKADDASSGCEPLRGYAKPHMIG